MRSAERIHDNRENWWRCFFTQKVLREPLKSIEVHGCPRCYLHATEIQERAISGSVIFDQQLDARRLVLKWHTRPALRNRDVEIEDSCRVNCAYSIHLAQESPGRNAAG